MKLLVFLVTVLVASTRAQIPSLGFCPEYLPMAGFEMERFAGIWYEAERYFQLTEVASRCVMSNYTKGPDGRFYVLNEVTSRFTGIKRVLEGEIKRAPSKAEEGKLHVKYSSVPLIPLETQYNVLETDYDNYAVMWSCSGIGPVHTQNAWIMTRQRVAPVETLQKAYAVLDKHKISKVFFVKTNQDDCLYLDNLQAEQAANRLTTEPPKKAAEEEEDLEEEESPQPLTRTADAAPAAAAAAAEIRPITPDAPEAIIKTRKAEDEAKLKKVEEEKKVVAAEEKKIEEEKKKIEEKQPVVEAPQPIAAPAEETVKSVPEVIMKIAAEASKAAVAAVEKELAKEPVKEEAKEPIIQPVKAEAAAPAKIEEEKPKEILPAAPTVVELPVKKQEIVEEKIEIVQP